jgi:hypothetical protein
MGYFSGSERSRDSQGWLLVEQSPRPEEERKHSEDDNYQLEPERCGVERLSSGHCPTDMSR